MNSIDGNWLKKHEVDEISNHSIYQKDLDSLLENVGRQEANQKEIEIHRKYFNNEKKVQDEALRFLNESIEAFETISKLDAIDEECMNQIKDTLLASKQIYQDNIKKYEAVINQEPTYINDKYPLIFYLTSNDLHYKRLKVEELISNLMTKYGIIVSDETLNDKKHF